MGDLNAENPRSVSWRGSTKLGTAKTAFKDENKKRPSTKPRFASRTSGLQRVMLFRRRGRHRAKLSAGTRSIWYMSVQKLGSAQGGKFPFPGHHNLDCGRECSRHGRLLFFGRSTGPN